MKIFIFLTVTLIPVALSMPIEQSEEVDWGNIHHIRNLFKPQNTLTSTSAPEDSFDKVDETTLATYEENVPTDEIPATYEDLPTDILNPVEQSVKNENSNPAVLGAEENKNEKSSTNSKHQKRNCCIQESILEHAHDHSNADDAEKKNEDTEQKDEADIQAENTDDTYVRIEPGTKIIDNPEEKNDETETSISGQTEIKELNRDLKPPNEETYKYWGRFRRSLK